MRKARSIRSIQFILFKTLVKAFGIRFYRAIPMISRFYPCCCISFTNLAIGSNFNSFTRILAPIPKQCCNHHSIWEELPAVTLHLPRKLVAIRPKLPLVVPFLRSHLWLRIIFLLTASFHCPSNIYFVLGLQVGTNNDLKTDLLLGLSLSNVRINRQIRPCLTGNIKLHWLLLGCVFPMPQ